MKAEYPNGEQKSALQETKRPFDKSYNNIAPTSIHPHSENRANQKNYHVINQNSKNQLVNNRSVLMNQTSFKSTLPQHPPHQKFTNYTTEYGKKFGSQVGSNPSARERTSSDFNKTRKQAGDFNQVPEEAVKPITTLYCQNLKEGDFKEKTQIQRSWVPSRDKSLSFSLGRTAEEFKNSGIPRNDIQTSLNMNIGLQNLHPKLAADNFFRHVRQDVTVAYNKTFCNRP